MYSQRPSWLEVCCSDSRPTPTLFAWNLSNLASYDGSGFSTSSASGDSDKRIYVLGVGNLGRLFALSLAQARDKPPITLVVHRKELLEQWVECQGIEILRNDKIQRNKDFDIEWWTETEPDVGPIREVAEGDKLKNLIITTKASAALPQVDRNGALFDENNKVLVRVIDQLLGETSQVLQLLVAHESSAEIIGQQETRLPAAPEATTDLSPKSLQERFSHPQLKNMIYQVGHKVRDNTSSMLQDVRAGRSTEIRDFNGWLVEMATFLDPELNVTCHGTLIELVEAGRTLD
ncbi:2-dehydropantoate 2-reductase (Ketopantoate reductase) (KPA reductase) (KPR) [Fusarium chlamydosporum]